MLNFLLTLAYLIHPPSFVIYSMLNLSTHMYSVLLPSILIRVTWTFLPNDTCIHGDVTSFCLAHQAEALLICASCGEWRKSRYDDDDKLECGNLEVQEVRTPGAEVLWKVTSLSFPSFVTLRNEKRRNCVECYKCVTHSLRVIFRIYFRTLVRHLLTNVTQKPEEYVPSCCCKCSVA